MEACFRYVLIYGANVFLSYSMSQLSNGWKQQPCNIHLLSYVPSRLTIRSRPTKMTNLPIRPEKKTLWYNPTDPVFFCADPAIFIAFQKKIKIFSYLPTLKCFRKLDKNLKNVRIAKLMLSVIFFNHLDVLNFILCMSSGTVNDI